MSAREEQIKKLTNSINFLIRCMKEGGLKPDRTWSASLNALIKKRDELEAIPDKSLERTPHPNT